MLSPSETTASEALLSRIAQLAPTAGDCGIVSLTEAYARLKSANKTDWADKVFSRCEKIGCDTEGAESESDTQGNDAPAASTTEAPASSTTRKPRASKAKDTPPAETTAAPAEDTTAAEPAAPATPAEPEQDPALADEPAAKTYEQKIAEIKAAYLAKCKATAQVSDEAGRKFKEAIVVLYTRLGGTRIGDIPEANIEKFVASMNIL